MNTNDEQQGKGDLEERKVAVDNDFVDLSIEQPRLPVEERSESKKSCCINRQRLLLRVIVVLGHSAFIAFAVLANFIYEWSNDSEGTVWLALINENVIQHLKTMLWPWLFILLPMDFLACGFVLRQQEFGEVEDQQTTWYFRCISQSSWLRICLANTIAMVSVMLFISVVFSILLYGGSTYLAVDITLYMIGIIAGTIVRILLMKRQVETLSWVTFAYLLGGIIWFFTYFSYSDNVYEGYWFDPNPYNHSTSEDGQ